MSGSLCRENCRISYPEDLRGDYVRGQAVWDERLALHYPSLFEMIPEKKLAAAPSMEEVESGPEPSPPEVEAEIPASSKKGARIPAMS